MADTTPTTSPTVPMRPAHSRGPGCWIAFAVIGMICAALGLCVFMSLIDGAGGLGEPGMMEKKVSGKGDAKLVLIQLNGVISQKVGGGGLFSLPGADLVATLKKQFDRAEKDADVKGVLFAIDSPGGAVTPSDRIWHLVKKFRERSGKPVLVHQGGVCASGGYYISVAADRIVCEPTTITGSIGVILSTMNFHELLKEHGVRDITITSGANKALLNPTSPVADEHRAILQAMIDTTHARFVKLVAEGRNLDLEVAKKLADGRIYTAEQALENKLVDEIGYREDAVKSLEKLAGVAEARLVRYTRQPTLAEALAGGVRAPGVNVELDLDKLQSPRLLALWRGR